MKAIELFATVENHRLQLPETIPEGTLVRALLLLNDEDEVPTKTRRRRPAQGLIGSMVLADDLIVPAVPPEDWNALK
jgi:hypothetical protein